MFELTFTDLKSVTHLISFEHEQKSCDCYSLNDRTLLKLSLCDVETVFFKQN